MIPFRIHGATRTIGPPAGWKQDLHGPCPSIAVLDEKIVFGHQMTTAWEVNPVEMAKLLQGGLIYLTILGTIHPAVMITARLPSYA